MDVVAADRCRKTGDAGGDGGSDGVKAIGWDVVVHRCRAGGNRDVRDRGLGALGEDQRDPIALLEARVGKYLGTYK